MPDEQIEALARARGLTRAWRDHPADVREAVASAAKISGAFQRPLDPTVEPIPPYAAVTP